MLITAFVVPVVIPVGGLGLLLLLAWLEAVLLADDARPSDPAKAGRR
jgi:hypothetical protein